MILRDNLNASHSGFVPLNHLPVRFFFLSIILHFNHIYLRVLIFSKMKGACSLRYIWGVDSAAAVTTELYSCVLKNFGKPMFWGRYLTRIPDASEALTREEVQLLHNSGTKVLPIYNNFREALGYDKGRVVAQNATFQAKRLGVPQGTVIFANVERFFRVDKDWIKGFVDVMFTSGYRAGIYHDPIQGGFATAYCQAVQDNQEVSHQLILWSAEPEPGVTKARQAPSYQPKKPPCPANVWGWQYGRDSQICPIDTNLIDRRLYNQLW